MANNSSFGQVLSLSGVGGLTTSYQAGSTFYGGACTFLRLKVVIATDAASTITSVTLKVQGIYAAADVAPFADVISYRLDTNTSQPELEHAYTTAANNTYVFAVDVRDAKGFAGGLQINAKAAFSSGAAKAGDSVTVSATGW